MEVPLEVPQFIWVATTDEQNIRARKFYPRFTAGSNSLLFIGDDNQTVESFFALRDTHDSLKYTPKFRITTYTVDPYLPFMNLMSENEVVEPALILFFENGTPLALPKPYRMQRITLYQHKALSANQQADMIKQFIGIANTHLAKACLPEIPQPDYLEQVLERSKGVLDKPHGRNNELYQYLRAQSKTPEDIIELSKLFGIGGTFGK